MSDDTSSLAAPIKSKWIENLEKYLKNNFSFKNNIWRIVGSIIGILICLIPALSCNLLIRNNPSDWSNAMGNSGIAFSIEMSPGGIYALQSIICVLLFGVILFTNKWYFAILLALAFTGGLFNIIDRATSIDGLPLIHGGTNNGPYVIDYLPTGSTTSNWPDVSVLVGIIGFAVFYILSLVINMIKDRKTKAN